MYKEKVSDYIDSHRVEMTDTLRNLVKIPSVKGEAQEGMPFGKANAEVLSTALEICSEIGLNTRNFENYCGTADYLSRDIKPELGILFHLDVVPEGTGWSCPPFDITEKGGKLIGRGTIDDKGPAVSVFYAVKAIKELGIPLKKNFRLIMGCDEENGSGDLEYYTKKEDLPENLFTPDGNYPVLNIEKGMIRSTISRKFSSIGEKKITMLKAGIAINAVPEKAEAIVCGLKLDEVMSCIKELNISVKFNLSESNGNIKIEVYGKSAHASKPELGINALTALIVLLAELPLDKSDSSDTVKALAKLYPFGENDGFGCGVKCCDDKSGPLTLLLSVFDLNEKGFTAHTDIRFPVTKTSNEIISAYRKSVEAHGISIETGLHEEPHYVDENSNFIQTLLSVYEDIKGEKGYCVAIGGLTYVHNTVGGVAFGVEYEDSDNHMHGADEFIHEDELLFNAKMFAEAIIRLCS